MKRLTIILSLLAVCFTTLFGQETATESKQAIENIFDKYKADKNLPSLIMFTADWCSPCQYMKNTVFKDEKVASLLNGMNVFLVDTETLEGAEYQKFYRNADKTIPYFILFDKDRKIVANQLGSNGAEEFVIFLNKVKDDESTEVDTMAPLDPVQDPGPREFIHITDHTTPFTPSWSVTPSAKLLFSKVTGDMYSKLKVGFSAEVNANYHAGRKIDILFGAGFQQLGGINQSGKALNLQYVIIPAGLDFHVVEWLNFGLGFYYGYRVNSITENFKRSDFGFRCSLNGRYKKFGAGINFTKGFLNMKVDDIISPATNLAFGVGVSYDF